MCHNSLVFFRCSRMTMSLTVEWNSLVWERYEEEYVGSPTARIPAVVVVSLVR